MEKKFLDFDAADVFKLKRIIDQQQLTYVNVLFEENGFCLQDHQGDRISEYVDVCVTCDGYDVMYIHHVQMRRKGIGTFTEIVSELGMLCDKYGIKKMVFQDVCTPDMYWYCVHNNLEVIPGTATSTFVDSDKVVYGDYLVWEKEEPDGSGGMKASSVKLMCLGE